jgi:antitoxin MazE
MKARIIRIGNSQGIRIPKPLLEQSGLGEDVELEVMANQIVIRAASHAREGWAKTFEAMAKKGDDALLDADVLPTEWDEEDWTW